MSKDFRKAKVLDIDGNTRENPDFPIAVVREGFTDVDGETGSHLVVDPIFTSKVKDNLYGRVMTLLEATCEPQKLQPVKDIFSKEISDWYKLVYDSAREISEGGDSSGNIYTKN